MKKSTKRKFPRYLAFDVGNDPSGQFARLASSEKSIQLELYVLVKLVYCPIISLTYIYEESYVMQHENSLSHRVVAGRTCGVEDLESRKNFAVAID